MKAIIFSAILAILLFGCAQKEAPVFVPEDVCGDGVCDEGENMSCIADCPVQQIDTTPPPPPDCIGEGNTVPGVPDALPCCSGLTMIGRKESSILGIQGICTAKCGNGVCDALTESSKNCAADCQDSLNAQPICDGIGTTKEGWYQNDKILFYGKCADCTAECKNIGSSTEGWYNSCSGKQLKRADCG